MIRSTSQRIAPVAFAALVLLASPGMSADTSGPVIDAVTRGDSGAIAGLVAGGHDVDQPNLYGFTPLWVACQAGDEPVVAQLIAAGADVNLAVPGGETPLMTSARTGVVEIIKMLVDAGADVSATERRDQTALMWAAARGNTGAVDTLVEAGADLQARSKQGFTALFFAARQGHLETVQHLVAAGAPVDAVIKPANSSGRNPRDRMSALMFAVESGHFELALWLVSAGADPDDQRSGYTPLHAVTWVRKTDRGDNVAGDPPPRGSGNVHSLDFVRRIVAAGADVNAVLRKGPGGRAKMNHRGATPFLMASKTADLPLLELLLELGADPTINNVDGCTPVMAAAGVGVVAVGEEAGTEPEVIAVIDWLCEWGLDPNAVDKNGETAMHGAAYRNFPAVVDRLAALGADPATWNHKNKLGWTPTMIASGKRPGSFKPSPETIAALERAMAQKPGAGSR